MGAPPQPPLTKDYNIRRKGARGPPALQKRRTDKCLQFPPGASSLRFGLQDFQTPGLVQGVDMFGSEPCRFGRPTRGPDALQGVGPPAPAESEGQGELDR